MIIGTCGHEITLLNVKQGLLIKEYTRKAERCIASIAVCPECQERYEAEGVILHNKREEEEWLTGIGGGI